MNNDDSRQQDEAGLEAQLIELELAQLASERIYNMQEDYYEFI